MLTRDEWIKRRTAGRVAGAEKRWNEIEEWHQQSIDAAIIAALGPCPAPPEPPYFRAEATRELHCWVGLGTVRVRVGGDTKTPAGMTADAALEFAAALTKQATWLAAHGPESDATSRAEANDV